MSANQNRILNCEESKQREEDWSFDAASNIGLFSQADTARSAGIPRQVDLREGWWEIGDQHATGSCVGWATADSVLRWMFTKQNVIRQGQHLSVRYLWMASKETDEFTSRPTTFIEVSGTSLKAALDVVRKYGIVLDKLLPFEPERTLYLGDSKEFYAEAAKLRYISYYNLGRQPALWREWMAKVGPVLTRLDCDRAFMTCSGKLASYNSSATYGGHAIALAGYNENDVLVRNSWGEDWGDQGYAWASEAYASRAFTEAYGVWVPKLAHPMT